MADKGTQQQIARQRREALQQSNATIVAAKDILDETTKAPARERQNDKGKAKTAAKAAWGGTGKGEAEREKGRPKGDSGKGHLGRETGTTIG